MCQNFCITQDSQQHIDIHYVTLVEMRFAYYFYLKVTPVGRFFFQFEILNRLQVKS